MQYYGYMGKVLYVDLTNGDIKEEALNPEFAGKYIGDFGLGARLIYDLIEPGIDSLSPENHIVIGAGPLCGTSYPGTSRCNLWTKFPLSNAIGQAGGGLDFAAWLKYAGYDELVITGRADNPVYLKVFDDDVEVCDATDLWGKDIHEATDEIWGKHGTDCSVMCMGQAGENLVKISFALIDKSSTIGRHGLGAVMGSKNLKLIIAGGKRKVRIHDRTRFSKMIDDMMVKIMNRPEREYHFKYGSFSATFDFMTRIAPRNYYREIITDPLFIRTMRDKFGPERHFERVKKARQACMSCPTACKNIDEIRHGEYKGQMIFASHPMFSPGTAFNFENLEEAMRCGHLLQKSLNCLLRRRCQGLLRKYPTGVALGMPWLTGFRV